MFTKILAITALVACAQAGVYELGHQAGATSYSSVNKQITPVATLHAAPVAHVAHLAPVATYHAAPVTTYHAAPVATYQSAPVTTYHSAPVATYHAAPVTAYHAAPVATYHAAPVVKAVHQEVYADSHPQYSYQYGVQDAHTGDVKNQHEERDGDVVKGVYSLVQPDGVTRTVHYSSDAHNGFNAQVEYTGQAAHPQQVQKTLVAKTLVAAAPVYQAYHH